MGLPVGLRTMYVAEHDPWHADGYISSDELGLLPEDGSAGLQPPHYEATYHDDGRQDHPALPQQDRHRRKNQPASGSHDAPPNQQPSMDPWNYLARAYAGQGPLLPPHLWHNDALGLHQWHQQQDDPDRVERPGQQEDESSASASASASTCALDDSPPPPPPQRDLPPPEEVFRDPDGSNWLLQRAQTDMEAEQEELADFNNHKPSHRDPDDETSSESSSSSDGGIPRDQPPPESKPRKRTAGHGSQRFKNKGQKSDVKALWRQLGWGDKPPWLSWRKTLPFIQRGERPPWQQPRIRPEHRAMIDAMRNAQNYFRDADGKVIPTGGAPPPPGAMSSQSQPPTAGPIEEMHTKAQTAAAEDHERRMANNQYYLPPHLRRSTSTTEQAPSTTTPTDEHGPKRASPASTGDALGREQTPPASTASSSQDPPPERQQPTKGPRVHFHLPPDHREHPPKPTRRKTVLRKLADSTITQLRIDGVLQYPVLLIDNRPTYMIAESDRGEVPPRHDNPENEATVTHNDRAPPVVTLQRGEPLSFQPPAIRNAARERDSFARTPGIASEAEQPVPAGISDLEGRAIEAAARGEVPSWDVASVNDEAKMQSSVRVGANTQDVSWLWGATPTTLPPAFPLGPNTILSLRGSADGSWRGLAWTPHSGQMVHHPVRHNHEPTVVIFNTFSTHKEKGATLPVGVRFTLHPVGPWVATTRIQLGVARTPKYWRMVIDETEGVEPQQGTIPLQAGESFWLSWNQNEIWSRKPRFQDDIAVLGGASIVPPAVPPRPPTPPERRNFSRDRVTNEQRWQPPRRPPRPTVPHVPLPGQRPHLLSQPQHPPERPRTGPSRPAASPGSESETSWPSDDPDDHDASGLMQTGGASSSTDPAPMPRTDDPADLLENLEQTLRSLLQLSFLQPREDVTDLAYRACSRLLRLREVWSNEGGHPQAIFDLTDTIPDERHDELASLLAEAQTLVQQLLLRHDSMSTSQLRQLHQQLQALLIHTRNEIEEKRSSSSSTRWDAALAGIKNAETAADALGLAVEEGSLASALEALEALHAGLERTMQYVDEITTSTARSSGGERPSKRKREGQMPPEPRPHRLLPERPDLPVPRHREAWKDQHLWETQPNESEQSAEREATPYQILRAQQIIEQILPFLEQDVATRLAQAHGLLFSWTTALWGTPIMLAETENDQQTQLHEGEIPLATAPPRPTSMNPTWPPLTRSSSHRRRRLHAAVLDSQDEDEEVDRNYDD